MKTMSTSIRSVVVLISLLTMFSESIAQDYYDDIYYSPKKDKKLRKAADVDTTDAYRAYESFQNKAYSNTYEYSRVDPKYLNKYQQDTVAQASKYQNYQPSEKPYVVNNYYNSDPWANNSFFYDSWNRPFRNNSSFAWGWGWRNNWGSAWGNNFYGGFYDPWWDFGWNNGWNNGFYNGWNNGLYCGWGNAGWYNNAIVVRSQQNRNIAIGPRVTRINNTVRRNATRTSTRVVANTNSASNPSRVSATSRYASRVSRNSSRYSGTENEYLSRGRGVVSDVPNISTRSSGGSVSGEARSSSRSSRSSSSALSSSNNRPSLNARSSTNPSRSSRSYQPSSSSRSRSSSSSSYRAPSRSSSVSRSSSRTSTSRSSTSRSSSSSTSRPSRSSSRSSSAVSGSRSSRGPSTSRSTRGRSSGR